MTRLKLLFIVALFLAACSNHKKNFSPAQIDTTSQVTAIDEMLKSDPGNPYLYNRRAVLLLKENDIKDALNDINIALKKDSLNPKYYITLSDIYFAMNMFAKSENMLEKALAILPDDTVALMKLSKSYLYFQKYDLTFQTIDRLLELTPHNAYAYLLKGFAYKETKDTSSSIKCYSTAIEEQPDLIEPYIQLGLLYAAKKNKTAVDFYEKALKIKPGNPDALYNIAFFYQETGEWKKAIDNYDELILKNGANKYAYYNIGYIYLEQLNDYTKAAQYFTNAIETDMSYAEAFFNRGLSYERSKNYTAAEADYLKALELKPGYQKATDALKRLRKK
jgi:tetratricopeptide (TPR) repeat protein